MAHNIFGERFLAHREPAWHRLGQVVEEGVTATEALDRIGSYNVRMEKIITESGLELPKHRVILRDPVVDDNTTRIFGIVTDEYQLVTPKEFAGCWDVSVQKEIETIGSLGKGEEIFISTTLPKFDVKGDEIDNYLLAYSPMTGSKSITLKVTPVRVVCQNTLSMALTQSGTSINIEHIGSVKTNLHTWLKYYYDLAVAKVEVIQEAYNLLADKSLGFGIAKDTLSSIYSIPTPPNQEMVLEDSFELKLKEWDYKNKAMLARREAAFDLWNGEGSGATSIAAAGTAWGLYNAVVEVEDYRKGPYNSAGHSSLVGERAMYKEKAFNQCLELVR